MSLLPIGITLFGISWVCRLQAASAAAMMGAEPASILYMVSGGIAFLFARTRYRKSTQTGTAMVFCSRSSRKAMDEIRLL